MKEDSSNNNFSYSYINWHDVAKNIDELIKKGTSGFGYDSWRQCYKLAVEGRKQRANI